MFDDYRKANQPEDNTEQAKTGLNALTDESMRLRHFPSTDSAEPRRAADQPARPATSVDYPPRPKEFYDLLGAQLQEIAKINKPEDQAQALADMKKQLPDGKPVRPTDVWINSITPQNLGAKIYTLQGVIFKDRNEYKVPQLTNGQEWINEQLLTLCDKDNQFKFDNEQYRLARHQPAYEPLPPPSPPPDPLSRVDRQYLKLLLERVKEGGGYQYLINHLPNDQKTRITAVRAQVEKSVSAAFSNPPLTTVGKNNLKKLVKEINMKVGRL